MSSESNGIAHPKRHEQVETPIMKQEGKENQLRFRLLMVQLNIL